MIRPISIGAAALAALSGWTTGNAEHVQMSEGDSSRLAQYEPVGLRLACLDRGGRAVKKFYPIDNHHIFFFMSDGRIFIGETLETPRCRGLKNAKGHYLGLKNAEAICAGDTIFGESGSAGSFSGDKYVGGTSRSHRCEFTAFQEVRVRFTTN